MRELHCATCQADMLFETLPYDEGPGDDAPELVCTGCGTAVMVAPITVRVWLRPRSAAGVAPQQRRAA